MSSENGNNKLNLIKGRNFKTSVQMIKIKMIINQLILMNSNRKRTHNRKYKNQKMNKVKLQ